MHVRVRAAVGAAVALLIATAGSASAQAAAPSFHCEASALRGSGVGFPAPIEPAVVGRAGACANASVLPTASLPATLQAQVLATTTYDGAAGTGSATGGVLSLKVVPTPELISQLPTEQAIDHLNAVTVALPAPVFVPILGTLVSSLTVDLTDALHSRIAAPTDALLSTDLVAAHANVACNHGAATITGSSDLVGVRVAGTEVPVNGPVTDSVTLIGSQQFSIAGLRNEVGILNPVTGTPATGLVLTTLQTLLAPVTQKVTIPELSLDVSLAPGGQLVEGDGLTQRALTAKIDLGGIHVLDATLGEAKVSAAAGTCALPPKTTPDTLKPVEEGGVDAITATGSVADQILACSDRRLVLMDVLRKGNMVKLLGAANRDYAGRRVAIRLRATNAVVAHATVQPDGSFQTTAPLPPRRFMTPARRDRVRYSAEIGDERSLPLKLERRMVVSSMSSARGKVRIAGRVVGPLTTPRTTIRLMRRLSCNKTALVKQFRPGPGGRFDVTVDAPKGQVAAVYRMTTFVRANRHNPKRFPTFTLPRGVALDTR